MTCILTGIFDHRSMHSTADGGRDVRAWAGPARDVAGRRSRVPPHSTPRELLDPASQDSQDFGTSQLVVFEERFGQDANLALLGRARGVFSAGSSSLP